MTTLATTPALGASRASAGRTLPRPGVAIAAAVAAGAALGALNATGDILPHTSHSTGGTAIAADLNLAGHSAQAAGTPTAPIQAAPTSPSAAAHVPAAAPRDAAADAVPELTKSTRRAAQAAKADAAIDRFESKIGSTALENWCERAVEQAYGRQGGYSSAIEHWHSSQQNTDWRHAPRGAFVFYNTSSDGHVAISLGDGRVVSTSAHHQVGIVPIDYFQHPLGWSPGPS